MNSFLVHLQNNNNLQKKHTMYFSDIESRHSSDHLETERYSRLLDYIPETTHIPDNMNSLIAKSDLDEKTFHTPIKAKNGKNKTNEAEEDFLFTFEDTTMLDNINSKRSDDTNHETDIQKIVECESPIDTCIQLIRKTSPVSNKQKNILEDIVPIIQIPNTPIKKVNPFFYESSENLSQSTTLNHNEQAIYKTGEGPCRICHKTVSNDKSVDRGHRPIFAKELSGQWHRNCFKCIECNNQLNRKNQCYVFNDQPFCQLDYHKQNGSLCTICHQGIENECLENHKNEKFHSACLKCFVCQRTIQRDYTLINTTLAMCSEHNIDDLVQQGIAELSGFVNTKNHRNSNTNTNTYMYLLSQGFIQSS